MNNLKDFIVEDKKNVYILNEKLIMLDFDLAKIYGCSNGPSELNYIVRKNIRLFPKKDYFLLTQVEYKCIIIQNRELEEKYDKDKLILPYAFSEYSVYLLSSIIKSVNATDIQRELITSFIKVKNYFNGISILVKTNILAEDKNIYLNNLFTKFNKRNTYNKYMLYDGILFDYLSFIKMIIDNAINYIIIIDNQIDINVLKQVNRSNIKILLVTKKSTPNINLKNIIIRENNLFKDLYILVDGSILYHASDYENNDYLSISIIKDKELISAFRRKLYYKL